MFGFETRADGTAVISGYVNAVGRDSRPVKVGMNKVIEQIMPGAFGEALRAAENVSMLLNHDYGQKLTDTLSGGLKLTEDSIGLRAEAVISDPDVIEKGRNGKLRGWSFGFRCIDDVMESRAEKLPRRIVKRLALNEVSVIDDRFIPCYEGTSVECRADGEADIEIRCFDSFATAEDMEEVTEERAEEPVTYDYSRFERAILDCEQREFQSRIDGEIRFNPYHDPSNGRFISAGGVSSGGAYLYSKGGKSSYVFERDIDSEYKEWAKSKTTKNKAAKNIAKETTSDNNIKIVRKGNDLYDTAYATPDDYRKALAEKYNGITDVDKIKTAKDVSDFINYDTQKGYYASYRKGEIQSTWNDPRYGKKTSGELARVRDAGFSSTHGTTVIDLPTGSKEIYKGALEKLDKAGIRVGGWYDDKYMILKKPRVRVSKWLEGLDNTERAEPVGHG